MKKVFVFLVVIAVVCGLIFANGSSETTTQKAKIGALVPSLSFDFQLQMSNGIQRAGQEKGYEVVINDYNFDSEMMLTGLDTMKAMNVKAMYTILLSPQVASDFFKSNRDIAAVNQGAPVDGGRAYTVNDYKKLGSQFVDSLNCYVEQNGIEAGEIVGLWLETCENKDSDYYTAMVDMIEIMEQWCKEKGDGFSFKSSFFPATDEDSANITAQVLNGYPNAKFFFCFNNGYAIACANEIASAKADTSEYFVFSSEGDPESFRLIADGTSPYRGCAYANIEESGYRVGLQLINWIENGQIENIPVSKDLVDSRNVENYLK